MPLTPTSNESTFLAVTSFGFALPASAVVKGITVTVTFRGSANIEDDEVRLFRNGVETGGDKKSDEWPANFATRVYGGPNDTWSTTLKSTDVNADGFGIAMRAKYDSFAGSGTAEIDSVSMDIAYCE